MRFKPNTSLLEKVGTVLLLSTAIIAAVVLFVSIILVFYHLFLSIWVEIKAFGIAIKWALTAFLSVIIGMGAMNLAEEFDLDTIDFD